MSLAHVGIADGNVPCSAVRDLVWDLHAVDPLKGLHKVEHAAALSGSQVEHLAALVFIHIPIKDLAVLYASTNRKKCSCIPSLIYLIKVGIHGPYRKH